MNIHLVREELEPVLMNHSVPASMRLTLAVMLYADDEGVARLPRQRLREILRAPVKGGRDIPVPASDKFIRICIDRLVSWGALTKDSTPDELVLTYGYRERVARA